MRRGATAARTALTAVIATGAVIAGLFVTGALDPVLNAAVTALRQKAADRRPATTDRTARVADWQFFDDRPEWSSLRGVPTVTGPVGPAAPVRPAVAPPENPHRWVFYGPPPMPHYRLRTLTDCPQPRGPGLYVQNFTVTTGTGGATVTWWDLGDPDTRDYTIVAVPNYVNMGDSSRPVAAPARVTTLVPAPKTCKQITVKVTGLINGNNYQFVLEARNKSNVNNRDYEVTRAQSGFVKIK